MGPVNPLALTLGFLVISGIGAILYSIFILIRNTINKSSMTPLMTAINEGDKEKVLVLLETGAQVNDKTRFGDTALILAAKADRADIAQLLIDKGADVNSQGVEKNTALIYAVKAKNMQLVMQLLDRGADVNIRNSDGLSAVVYSALHDNCDTAKILLYKGAVDLNGALLTAVGNGNLELSRLFVENGANVNVNSGSKSEAPLFEAIRANNVEMAKYLISVGADVNSKFFISDYVSNTPLLYAKVHGSKEIYTIIAAAGGRT